MWDLPGPGIEPVSPALAGGFFTSEPPGKPGSKDLIIPVSQLTKLRYRKVQKCVQCHTTSEDPWGLLSRPLHRAAPWV